MWEWTGGAFTELKEEGRYEKIKNTDVYTERAKLQEG